MILRFMLIVTSIIVFSACERSSRDVEIQPTPKHEGIGKGDGRRGGGRIPEDEGNADPKNKTASLSVTVDGLPATASSARLEILVNDESHNETVTLSGGSGEVSLRNLAVGSAVVDIKAQINNEVFKGSANTTIRDSDANSVRVTLKLSSNNPTPPRGGESDVIIDTVIGGGSTTPTQPTEWDGLSFQGNNYFSVEPVQ